MFSAMEFIAATRMAHLSDQRPPGSNPSLKQLTDGLGGFTASVILSASAAQTIGTRLARTLGGRQRQLNATSRLLGGGDLGPRAAVSIHACHKPRY